MGKGMFSDAFKLKAVSYAIKHGWSKASKKFEVFWMTLNQWRNQLAKKGKLRLRKQPKKKARGAQAKRVQKKRS
jgi:transposase-like protein